MHTDNEGRVQGSAETKKAIEDLQYLLKLSLVT